MNTPTKTIAARDLRTGHQIIDTRVAALLTVRKVSVCTDGSLRIQTDIDEQRMTGSILVRVLH